MNDQQFYLQLAVLSSATGLVLFLLTQVPQLQGHGILSWIGLFGFIVLSILMYYTGKRSAKSENKNDFTNVVLGFTIGKMFMAILIVYAYIQIATPEDKLFILPFFGVYLVFTAFETYFMMNLGKSKV